MSASVPVQGDPVQLALYNVTFNTTSSVALGIFDQNGVARTLQPYERLVIDDINFGTTDASGASIFLVSLAAGAALTSVTSGLILATFNSDSSTAYSQADHDPINVPLGIVPSFLATASNTGNTIAGLGHIITGGTQGSRPSWRESLASHAL